MILMASLDIAPTYTSRLQLITLKTSSEMEIEFEVEVGFLPVNASLIVEVELPVPVPELVVPVYAFETIWIGNQYEG